MPARKRAEKSQRQRFKQAARELGVELDEEKLKEVLRKIAPDAPKRPKELAGKKPQRG